MLQCSAVQQQQLLAALTPALCAAEPAIWAWPAPHGGRRAGSCVRAPQRCLGQPQVCPRTQQLGCLACSSLHLNWARRPSVTAKLAVLLLHPDLRACRTGSQDRLWLRYAQAGGQAVRAALQPGMSGGWAAVYSIAAAGQGTIAVSVSYDSPTVTTPPKHVVHSSLCWLPFAAFLLFLQQLAGPCCSRRGGGGSSGCVAIFGMYSSCRGANHRPAVGQGASWFRVMYDSPQCASKACRLMHGCAGYWQACATSMACHRGKAKTCTVSARNMCVWCPVGLWGGGGTQDCECAILLCRARRSCWVQPT